MAKVFLSAAATDCFARCAAEYNRIAIRAVDKINDGEESAEHKIVWHKPSPISAKTLFIKAKNIAGKIDEVFYYFDEMYFFNSMKTMKESDCLKLLEEECAGLQFLTLEALSFFASKRQNEVVRPRLIFLIRKNFSLIELLREGMEAEKGSLPHISAAAAAFMAFAENIAALYEGKNIADFTLVLSDCADENFRSDDNLAKWLFQYIDDAEARKKSGVQWIKAGARASHSFSLFGR